MWKWRAGKQKKRSHFCLFACFQSCELLSFLSPPVHSVSTLKIVVYLPSTYCFQCLFFHVLSEGSPSADIFPRCAASTPGGDEASPGAAALCNSFFRTQHGQEKEISFGKNTRCVQYFHFFVGLPCVAVGPAVTFHMPGIGTVCLVPDAIGVPRVSCHSQLVWKIQGAGCFFFF